MKIFIKPVLNESSSADEAVIREKAFEHEKEASVHAIKREYHEKMCDHYNKFGKCDDDDNYAIMEKHKNEAEKHANLEQEQKHKHQLMLQRNAGA
jgi:hypothetical protein